MLDGAARVPRCPPPAGTEDLGKESRTCGHPVRGEDLEGRCAVAVRASVIVVLLIVVTSLAPVMVSADCIDYGAYMHWIAGIELPGSVRAVEISGALAFALWAVDDTQGNDTQGLNIIDLTNPERPWILGILRFSDEQVSGGGGFDLACVGSYVYVTIGWAELKVIDVSNPRRPQLVHKLEMPSYAKAVAIRGSYAYVGAGNAGIQVLDVSDPREPRVVANIDTAGMVHDLVVAGDRAYATETTWDRFEVIDIADPLHPAVLSSLNIGYPGGLAVAGDFAYVLTGGYDDDDSLDVFDVSDAAHPRLVGSAPGGGWGIALSGQHAFVANGQLGLVVYDIADATKPQRLGQVYAGSAFDVAIAGDLAYVGDYWEALQVLDISNALVPPVIGSVGTQSRAIDVAVSGSYAYVAGIIVGPNTGYLEAVDITDPQNPRVVGTLDTPAWALRVTTSGDFAYVAAGSHPGNQSVSRLLIVDIGDPQNLRNIGSVEMPWMVNDMSLAGSYAVVAGSSRLWMVDVADPEHPTIVGEVATGSYTKSVAVAGHYALAAVDYVGLRVIDIAEPDNPRLVSTLQDVSLAPHQDRVVGVCAVGSYAYIIGDELLRVVDIADQEHPRVVGRVHVPIGYYGWNSSVTVAGNTAYVGGRSVQIVDVSNPHSPRVIGGQAANPNSYVMRALGIAVSDAWAYVTGELGGLRILPLQCESPTGPGAGGRTTALPPPNLALSYPNPFNAGTTIRLDLPKSQNVEVAVYGVDGRRVKTLCKGWLPAGPRVVSWDGLDERGESVASGTYLYRIEAGSDRVAGKLVLVK
jgi:hypothetical protein